MCHPESGFRQIVRGSTLLSFNNINGILGPKTFLIIFNLVSGSGHVGRPHSVSLRQVQKIFRLPSVFGIEKIVLIKLWTFLTFFSSIFLQTEKRGILRDFRKCCASSYTQGCLRLHATFQIRNNSLSKISRNSNHPNKTLTGSDYYLASKICEKSLTKDFKSTFWKLTKV